MRSASQDIKGAIIARVDGLPIVSDLPKGVDPKRIAATSATLLGTAQTSCKEIKAGECKVIIIESEEGKLISMAAGELAVLSCLVKQRANLGFVLLLMERASARIEKMVKGIG